MEDDKMRENSENDLSKVPKNLQPHVFKKGQIANPLGRKKGSVSLKQYAKQMLESMTYEERMEYLEGLPKQFIWEMAEGKAESKTDITSGGKQITVNVLSFKDADNDTP
jgi:F0F1-type ATP synthase delta subunit